jgi:hypothetical protein
MTNEKIPMGITADERSAMLERAKAIAAANAGKISVQTSAAVEVVPIPKASHRPDPSLFSFGYKPAEFRPY